MSEEVLQAAGDLAYWRARAVRAESDVAALSAAISAYIAAGDTHARANAWRAMRDLAETAHPGAALRERAEQAEADAAALREMSEKSIRTYCGRCGSCHRCIRDLPVLDAEHPGAALLAELHAARAVVELTRDERTTAAQLAAAVANYDAARQGRME